MSNPNNEQIFANYQARIIAILSEAKVIKPSLNELVKNINDLWNENTYKKLSQSQQLCLVYYADVKLESLLKEYTILLSIGLNGRKFIQTSDNLTEEEIVFIKNGGKLTTAFFWLDKLESSSNEGIINVTYYPTSRIYYICSVSDR